NSLLSGSESARLILTGLHVYLTSHENKSIFSDIVSPDPQTLSDNGSCRIEELALTQFHLLCSA
ncbi:MAG: hypothetical protein WBZ36_12570, partial [Candidatus Nitrosopolaris sp.]